MLRRAVAAVVLAAAAVPACGGGDDPSVLASSSTEPTASVATTTSAPLSGSQADQIRAAVRTYFETVEDSAARHDVRRLLRLSLSTCGCRALARHIQAQKGYARGLEISIEAIELRDLAPRSAFAVVTWTESAHTVVDDAGRVVQEFPRAATIRDEMRFSLNSGRWIVAEVVGLR